MPIGQTGLYLTSLSLSLDAVIGSQLLLHLRVAVELRKRAPYYYCTGPASGNRHSQRPEAFDGIHILLCSSAPIQICNTQQHTDQESGHLCARVVTLTPTLRHAFLPLIAVSLHRLLVVLFFWARFRIYNPPPALSIQNEASQEKRANPALANNNPTLSRLQWE
jgi:hypothetical protein